MFLTAGCHLHLFSIFLPLLPLVHHMIPKNGAKLVVLWDKQRYDKDCVHAAVFAVMTVVSFCNQIVHCQLFALI